MAIPMAMSYQGMRQEISQIEARLLQEQGSPVSRKAPAVTGGKVDVQRIALELRQARAVVQQLDLPWDELFRSVESADAPTVALLGIESAADRKRLQITAEAKNFEAMLRYIRELEGRELFAQVYLSSHQIQLQDPQRPVRFMLSASWRIRQ